ncbi:hypothetical protein Hdeb2414_s0949g00965461 [Helianthus debilis subsp. tardiflorus]
MQKKRWRKLGLLRRMLTCAIALISMVALFSAHLQLFSPPSQVSMLPDPYTLPMGVIRVLVFLNLFVELACCC